CDSRCRRGAPGPRQVPDRLRSGRASLPATGPADGDEEPENHRSGAERLDRRDPASGAARRRGEVIAKVKIRKLILTSFVASLITVSARAEEPFNGRDLKGWKFRGDAAKSKWQASIALLDPKDPAKIIANAAFSDSRAKELVNAEGHSVDIYTEAKFGDCAVEV